MNPALDSRARFEAWARELPDHTPNYIKRFPKEAGSAAGKYFDPVTELAWEAWQAAIASMWQPIETVPTDGSMFIVWFAAVRFEEDEDGKLHEHDASTADFAAWRADPEHGGYVDCFGAPHGDGGGPTHWQPITPPIAALAAKEKT